MKNIKSSSGSGQRLVLAAAGANSDVVIPARDNASAVDQRRELLTEVSLFVVRIDVLLSVCSGA